MNIFSGANSSIDARRLLPIGEATKAEVDCASSVGIAADIDPEVIAPRAFGELFSLLAPIQTSFDLSFDLALSSSCDMNDCVKLLKEWTSDPPLALQYVSATKYEPPFDICIS